MSSIKLKHASGNGVSITAPSSNPAADRTLTLPGDADGIIAKTDADGNITMGDFAAPTDLNSAQVPTLFVDRVDNNIFGEDGALYISQNAYFNNSGSYERVTTQASTQYKQRLGKHKFITAAGGTAGANFSFSEKVTIDTDGLKFNGDTAAANALDDYEEGEHTITTNSNLTAHSSYNKADYTKVGNMVTVTFLLYVQGVSGSDTVTVSMPFANRNESVPRMCQAVGNGMWKNINTGNAGLIPYLDAGSSTLKFYKLNDDASWAVLDNGDLNAADEMYVTITYKTAT